MRGWVAGFERLGGREQQGVQRFHLAERLLASSNASHGGKRARALESESRKRFFDVYQR